MILAEENGVFAFRISDGYGAQMFNLDINEIRALRDVLNQYVKKWDENEIRRINYGFTPPPSPGRGPCL